MKELYCEKCLRQIKIRPDLVTTYSYFTIGLFHEECYAKSLKGIGTLFVSNKPINGASGNLTVGITVLMAIIVPLLGMSYFLSLLLLLPLAVRLYSWFGFERHLER